MIGFPFFKISCSTFNQLGFFFAKLSEINFCLLLRIFIVTVLEFLKIFSFEDFLSSENNTNGGDKDNEENELIVFPYKVDLLFVATIVIPVTNFDKVFLKSFILIFFIILFAL
tara:strand:- start:714 stop:1052 length:339 start_codon:yes stop_codon:yes gene_type:complete